jgi:hypothetical protein
VIELPEFDTGLYEGFELLMKDGGAMLSIKIAEQPTFRIGFTKVRWHQFTALPNCKPTHFNGTYFKLSEVQGSQELKSFLAEDRSSTKAYNKLHHYRIFLDESGCHEFFAETAVTCS